MKKDFNKNRSNFNQPLLKTPFYEMIASEMTQGYWDDWAGYKAASIVQDQELEYFAIRSTASVFDISPLIKYRIKGKDAENFLNKLTVRNVSLQKINTVQYTMWCDDNGSVLDDGTLFKFDVDDFRICCQERNLPWLIDTSLGFDVEIIEETEDIAGLSIQGPTSASVLIKAGYNLIEKLKPFEMLETQDKLLISRTGFTGDLGYEIFLPNKLAKITWDKIWKAGENLGIKAIGLNALNIARIETGFIIANSDFITSEHALRNNRIRNPDEIGMSWMVDMTKPYFNGKNALIKIRDKNESKFVFAALEIDGKEPADGAIIYYNKKQEVGIITAATWSPTAKKSIALASLKLPYGDEIQSNLWVEIYVLRELEYYKMMKKVIIVKAPFVKLKRRNITPPLSK